MQTDEINFSSGSIFYTGSIFIIESNQPAIGESNMARFNLKYLKIVQNPALFTVYYKRQYT